LGKWVRERERGRKNERESLENFALLAFFTFRFFPLLIVEKKRIEIVTCSVHLAAS
jgi:hypothetical protein